MPVLNEFRSESHKIRVASRFDPAEQVSINNGSRFHSTKVVKLRSEVRKWNTKVKRRNLKTNVL